MGSLAMKCPNKSDIASRCTIFVIYWTGRSSMLT